MNKFWAIQSVLWGLSIWCVVMAVSSFDDQNKANQYWYTSIGLNLLSAWLITRETPR